jgi:hypothetical protein
MCGNGNFFKAMGFPEEGDQRNAYMLQMSAWDVSGDVDDEKHRRLS